MKNRLNKACRKGCGDMVCCVIGFSYGVDPGGGVYLDPLEHKNVDLT